MRKKLPVALRKNLVMGKAKFNNLSKLTPRNLVGESLEGPLDTHSLTRKNLTDLRALLTQNDIEYSMLAHPRGEEQTLGIFGMDGEEFYKFFKKIKESNKWYFLTNRGMQRVHSFKDKFLKKGYLNSGLKIFRYYINDEKVVLAGPDTGIEIQFWKLGKAYDSNGGLLPNSFVTKSPLADTISGILPAEKEQRLKVINRLRTDQHIFTFNEPVDLVYTWVDGNDPDWQIKKNNRLREILPDNLHESSYSESRFDSRSDLKFSLASVEAYANWVRNIFIVTDGQTPKWLNVEHPKIKIVDHRDIFKNKTNLPVFNSHAIESQIHHIKGLSKYFLYLNDDIFFGRKVHPRQFFEPNGLTKFFLSSTPLDLSGVQDFDLPVLSAAKNNRELILSNFDRWPSNRLQHTPFALNKDILFEMEELFPTAFDEVSKSVFRSYDDYSIPSSLYHYYAYATGRSIPGEIAYGYFGLTNKSLDILLAKNLITRDKDVFCLNETSGDKTKNLSRVERFLRQYFSNYENCSFIVTK